jgi:uncharacterized protein YjiS (DUF1127 family)
MQSEQTVSNEGLASGTTARRPLHRTRWWAAVVVPVDAVRTWVARERSRRALAALDDHQLRDIGLSRSEIWHQCSKPFWRP